MTPSDAARSDLDAAQSTVPLRWFGYAGTVNAEPAFRIGAIHVVESLPPGDLRTGERLEELISPLAQASLPELAVQFSRPRSRIALLEQFEAIAQFTIRENRAPLVHIETHGSQDGFELASGDFVPWSDLKEPLTRLNVLCRLNLIVMTGACDGAGLINVIDIADRAPLWGFVGATSEITAGQVDDAFSEFYRVLFALRDGGKALAAMNARLSGENRLVFIGARDIFVAVMRDYFRAECTPDRLAERVRRQSELYAPKLNGRQRTLFEKRVAAHLSNHSLHFDRFKTRFFFSDLCPENDSRFPVDLATLTCLAFFGPVEA